MSISVFSNHFIECHYNYLLATQPQLKDSIKKPTLSEAFDAWIDRKDLYNRWCPQLLLSLHPEDEIADKNIFNRVCVDFRLRNIEKWATNNLLLCIRRDWKIQTRNVKFRIAAGMLNNLVANNCISSSENVYIFNNIVRNVRELSNDLTYSDLPF